MSPSVIVFDFVGNAVAKQFNPVINTGPVFTVSALTSASATVSWTAYGPMSTVYSPYEYELRTNGQPGTGPESLVSSGSGMFTSVNLSGLNANSTYTCYVRTKCRTNYTNWYSVSFTTQACSSQNVPYVENFDGAVRPAVPNCIKVENVNGATTWQTAPSLTGMSGPTAIKYTFSATSPADDWFFLRGLNLLANTTYALRFKFAGTSYPEKMEVRVGTSQDAGNLRNGLQIFNNLNISASGDGIGLFTPTTSGVYYFGFHAYSDANQNALYVDDINVSPTFILPLAQLNFSGILKNGNAALAWSTLDEVNTAVFDVERSTDGIHFNRLGSVSATGGMSRLAEYAYVDDLGNSNPGALYYYRLKVFDKDGSFVYSKVISILLKDKNLNITANPNPFREQIDLTIQTITTGTALVSLTGMSGKLLYQRSIHLQPGKNSLRINGSWLTKGIYVLQVEGQSSRQVMRLSKE